MDRCNRYLGGRFLIAGLLSLSHLLGAGGGEMRHCSAESAVARSEQTPSEYRYRTDGVDWYRSRNEPRLQGSRIEYLNARDVARQINLALFQAAPGNAEQISPEPPAPPQPTPTNTQPLDPTEPNDVPAGDVLPGDMPTVTVPDIPPPPPVTDAFSQPLQAPIAQAPLAIPPARAPGFDRLARVPPMIGDNPFTGQQAFFTANLFNGGLVNRGSLASFVSHPSQGGMRMDVAEFNSAQPQDRFFLDFRTFSNVADVDFLGFDTARRQEVVGLDRFLIGHEHRFGDDTSLELRIPIQNTLGNHINFSSFGVITASTGWKDETRLGNINLILKHKLLERGNFFFSGGLGLNLPTAEGAAFNLVIDDPFFLVVDPSGVVAPNLIDLQLDLEAKQKNETVNLVPYLAARWLPNDTWAFQGFLQLDVPLNESTIKVSSDSAINGGAVAPTRAEAKLGQQTLLRMNMGLSRRLYEGCIASSPYALGLSLEAHYTTALNEADLVGPIQITDDLGAGIPVLLAGNPNNRIDTFNFVVGLPLSFPRWNITNAFGFPTGRTQGDRAFDAEYMLILGYNY